MAVAVCGDTLTDAWLADVEFLHEHNREQLNLITTIADPNPKRADSQVIAELDALLRRKQKQCVGTVANTIFPAAYLRGCANRQEFYDRYLARLPRLRKQQANRQGTYFGRLIEYPASANVRVGTTFNQIEALIQKLERQLGSNGSEKRFTYQAQIFVPCRDTMSIMSFPCMSFVSFQLYEKRLCLTAHYRNQYYFERALGNFLGLARLQTFVADETGLDPGSLTVHACHAQIDILGKRAQKELIAACREHPSRAIVVP